MADKKAVKKMNHDLDKVVGTKNRRSVKKNYMPTNSEYYAEKLEGSPRDAYYKQELKESEKMEALRQEDMSIAHEIADYIAIRYGADVKSHSSYGPLYDGEFAPVVVTMDFDNYQAGIMVQIYNGHISIINNKGMGIDDMPVIRGDMKYNSISEAEEAIDALMREFRPEYFASSRKSLRKGVKKSKSVKKSQCSNDIGFASECLDGIQRAIMDITGVSSYSEFTRAVPSLEDNMSQLHDSLEDVVNDFETLIELDGDGKFASSRKGMRKSELPEDADDTQDDTEGEATGHVELPEDADDTQDDTEGEDSEQTGLPADAEDGLNQKDGTGKRLHKFSVATHGGQQYDGRQKYNQSPMMRQCIDEHFKVSEDEVVKMLNDRLDIVTSHSLIPRMKKSVPFKVSKKR